MANQKNMHDTEARTSENNLPAGKTQGEQAEAPFMPLNGYASTTELQNGQPSSLILFVPPLVSSLSTLSQLKGQHISPQHIVASLPGGFTPPSLDECLRAGARAGLSLRLYQRQNITDIPAPTLPCALVLQTAGNGQLQSCVLLAVNKKDGMARAIFPETSPESVEVPLAELQDAYSGHTIFAVAETPRDQRAEDLNIVPKRHWFWDIIRNYAPLYRDVALASLVINLLGLATPLFIMNVYDRVITNNAFYTLWMFVIGLLIAHAMDIVLRQMRSYFVDMAGRNTDVIIGARLMDKVLNMRMEDKPSSTGALANNLREFEQIRDFAGSNTLLTLFDLPFLILFLIFIGFIGGPIVILPILAMPLMLVSIKLAHLPFRRAMEGQLKRNMQKNSLLVEIIGGLETVKASMAQGQFQNLWERVIDKAAEDSARSRALAEMVRNSTLLVTYLLNAAVIILGVYLIAAERMSQGALIACVILVGRSVGPLLQTVGMLVQLQRSRVSMRALDKIMYMPGERQRGIGVETAGLLPELEFSHVSFSYPESKQSALRDLSLHIHPGERIAIIGGTGSGKSTLARLLAGLYMPADGSISFGGIDIRQIDPADLRRRVSYMPQDNYLFYGSVRDNIALGSPWLDMAQMIRAAELAGVADFVRHHPMGYDMPVGERGQALSGGQRQAVALARTLVRQPDVLLLDEPTSNMDVDSEQRLIHRLQAFLPGKTVILLTHRMSTLALAERLLVMHDGAIIADGPRDSILAAMREGRINTGRRT